jgi:NADPH:quinone reductase-like Zn-dependent oxidoreductase
MQHILLTNKMSLWRSALPLGSDELVVKDKAIAINPVDVSVPAAGSIMSRWLKYPCVLGSDVSGVVVDVGAGENAERLFKVGDRVIGLTLGID